MDLLGRSLALNKLSHAYIFSGPEGVGKKTTALRLAQILVCSVNTGCGDCPQCKSFAQLTNPDVLLVESPETIKIEEIRDLIRKLSLKPYMAKRKVAIIDHAEDMTSEAANSLLKVMEEPKSETTIILITANPNRLLPTIRSRAQKIIFGSVIFEEYSSLLPNDLSALQLEAVRMLSLGRPGVALKIAKDPSSLENVTKLDKNFSEFTSDDLSAKLLLAASLAESETSELKDLLLFFLTKLEQQLLSKKDDTAALRLEKVAAAISKIESNLNSKLVMTDLMLQT